MEQFLVKTCFCWLKPAEVQRVITSESQHEHRDELHILNTYYSLLTVTCSSGIACGDACHHFS